jgi:hypothetical protein
MARPVVLVYQEYASVTVTPATPDLNCLIVGPAYWIRDYLDDKGAAIQVADYGTQNADNPYLPPAPATDAITIAEPPGNKVGALLVADSVQVYFDKCRVRIAEEVGDPATYGAVISATGVPHNKIDCTACNEPGNDFITQMVNMKAGDYVIIEDPAGGTPNLHARILSVDVPNKFIYTTTNFPAGSANKKRIRVEREVNDVAIDRSFVVVTGNQIIVQGGVTTLLTGETVPRTVCYANVYVEYLSLRQDLRALATVSSETDVITKIGKNDARNPLAGCCVAALKNTTAPVQFFGVKSDDVTGHSECLEIIAGRKDIYAEVPLTVNKSIIQAYNTQNTQLASVAYAESAGIPQKFRVVIGAQTLPTNNVVSPADGTLYNDGQHASVDGAITNTPIVAADSINVFYDAAATFLTAGVRAGDVLVIVSDTSSDTRVGSYVIAAVYDQTRLRTTTAIGTTNKNTGAVRYYIIRGTGTPESTLPASWTAAGATTAPNTITTDIDRSLGVTDEYCGKIARCAGGLAGDYLITASTAANPAVFTAWPVLTSQSDVSGTIYNPLVAVTTPRDCTTRRPFRIVKSATAAHLTNIVRAGDALEISSPVAGPTWTFANVFSHVIAYIPNENDLVLATNEDAEAYNPSTGDTPSSHPLHFRVNRALTKDDQVTALVSISQSFKSRRTVLVWPDAVLVDGLVDGSKPRTNPTVPEAADPQPGYYLAAIVGGLTSGLPSHQGFTNLGIAGITQIYHSTRYFSDAQLTTLSDGGWFLFVQETPEALPYCLHQLTTDPSTLETGEYSVVKNFDFVSMFFQDILEDFLGQYNVNDETLGLLHQALDTGVDLLKLRKYAKIGAPLLSATVTSVAQSVASADRAEIYVEAELPKPLNRIGLHLISS